MVERSIGVGDIVRSRNFIGESRTRGVVKEILPPTTNRPNIIRARVTWNGQGRFTARRMRRYTTVFALKNLELIESAFKTQYPEHEKLDKVVDKSQEYGEFLDWFRSQGYVFARYTEGDSSRWVEPALVPADFKIEDMLGKYFDIDPKKLSAEKEAMYQEIRRHADQRQAANQAARDSDQ